MISEHSFPSAEDSAAAVAGRIAAQLREGLAARGAALLAVSGGRSPLPIFAALRSEPLDWARVTVTLVDERWVPPDHADSNERLVREQLLAGPAAAATFVPLKTRAPTAREGQPACEAAITALPRPFDVILLGMGEDGHTASLFPGAPELGHALSTDALTAAVTPPAAPHKRMTLTLAALCDSRSIHLPIAGETKRAVYARALADGPVEELPIRSVLRQAGAPVDVWIAP